MTSEQKAYFAGLFDGEGWVIIAFLKGRKSRTHFHQLVVGCQMATQQPIVELCTSFGGSVRLISKRNLRHSPTWNWVIQSRKAALFLESVLPYLLVKKRQAELAIGLQDGIKTGNNQRINEVEFARREYIRAQIKSLNGRGVNRVSEVAY